MFGLLKKIIDDKTLRHYCGTLTGALPSGIPYCRDKRPPPPGTYGSRLLDRQKDRGVKNTSSYELVFYYDNKNPEADELIYLEFEEYYDKNCNQVALSYTRITDSAVVSLSMREPAYDAFNREDNITQLDVEMAIEIAKWMVAKGMGNGRILANDVINRKSLAPRYFLDCL
jgi:hypothetical protein